MSDNFFQSALLRSVALGAYRTYARAQIWRRGPRIFVNSLPKSGTHLVTALLAQVPGLQNSRLWVFRRMVTRQGAGQVMGDTYEFDPDAFRRLVRTVRPGQFFAGHVQYHPEAAQILREEDVSSVFVIRHPLDVLVSKYHYIMELKRHPRHAKLANMLSVEDRLDYLREGSPKPPFMLSMAGQLESYVGWLDDERTMVVRFEELCGERGGGSDAERDARMADVKRFCGIGGTDDDQAFAPSTSVTFRRGQKNAWSQLLTREWLDTLDDQTVSLIRRFGYGL